MKISALGFEDSSEEVKLEGRSERLVR